MIYIVYLCFNKSDKKMKSTTPTPAQIRSAKIQDMTPIAFVNGLSALAESIKRGKGLVK